MKALVFERSLPRFAAARVAHVLGSSSRAASLGPLRLVDTDPPELPADGWVHVRPLVSGICGSDLATIEGASSRYFEPMVSFPFIPGHEVVGVLEDVAKPDDRSPALTAGSRVVLEPVLGCAARGIEPPCSPCARGETGSCQNLAFGHLSPGLQTGFCADTGGGWSTGTLVAHLSQLHEVPASMSDEEAVMVEPAACALHAVLGAGIAPGSQVAVLGAGTLGLLVVAAIRQVCDPSSLLVGARYHHQRVMALELGADQALEPEELARALRRRSRSMLLGVDLTGGADVVIDCVASSDSIRSCLAMVRPRGRVVLLGMPAKQTLDLTPLWHREISLSGAYAYGTENVGDGRRRTFELAMELTRSARLGRLVSARYPIDRFEEAIAHAASAGRRGSVKVVFDLAARPPRSSKGRSA